MSSLPTSPCLSTIDYYLAQKHHGEITIGSTTQEVGIDSQELALQIHWRALAPESRLQTEIVT